MLLEGPALSGPGARTRPRRSGALQKSRSRMRRLRRNGVRQVRFRASERFGLALGAEVRGSAAEDDAGDGGAAGVAGFSVAGVDAVELLESAGVAVGVDVVAEG